MTIKESILALPVWKLAVSLFVASVLLTVAIEWVVVGKVLSVLHHSVSSFERMAAADNDDLNNDLREYDERHEYEAAMSAYDDADLRLYPNASAQEKGCFHWMNIKRFEAMRSLAYLKHSAPSRQYVEQMLASSRESVKVAIANHQFDPALCKVKSS